MNISIKSYDDSSFSVQFLDGFQKDYFHAVGEVQINEFLKMLDTCEAEEKCDGE